MPDVEVISIDQEHVLGIEIPETEKLQSNLANAPPTTIKLYKIFGVYLV
uniref:Uncharacterized protein n=1 Tax=uncultured Flavobacteriia bacterium TaxID=212695 RepID=H6RFX3_9BACT|nr:hypothetical protein VIS_S3CCB20033 [uncultured Flavobacteriia bacterium]